MFLPVVFVFQSVIFILKPEIGLLQQHMAIESSTSCKPCQLWPDLWTGSTSSKLRCTTDQLVNLYIYGTFFSFYFEKYLQMYFTVILFYSRNSLITHQIIVIIKSLNASVKSLDFDWGLENSTWGLRLEDSRLEDHQWIE